LTGDGLGQGDSGRHGRGLPFDRSLRLEFADQSAHSGGETTFLEFATAAWRGGVLNSVVDLENRTCTYFGLAGESYVERYRPVPAPH
jgi:hypothetical protein